MAEKWVEIPKNLPLAPGAVIRLHYKTIGITYLTAAQISLIEKRLEQKREFTVVSHSIPKKDGFISQFYFECEIHEPTQGNDPEVQKAGISPAFVAAAIVAAAFVMYLALQLVEIKVMQSSGAAAEKIGTAAEKSEKVVTSISGAIMAAIAGYVALKVLEK